MIETKSLILDKAKIDDYLSIYENIWSKENVRKYMFWDLTTSIEEAKVRMQRTIEYEKKHPYAFLVYLKETKEAIGYAGIHISGKNEVEENGIALGEKYWHQGYGKEILNALIDVAFKEIKANKFIYQCQKDNKASYYLAKSCGFELIEEYVLNDEKNKRKVKMLKLIKNRE